MERCKTEPTKYTGLLLLLSVTSHESCPFGERMIQDGSSCINLRLRYAVCRAAPWRSMHILQGSVFKDRDT